MTQQTMPRRRPPGSGSISRGSDGMWIGRVELPAAPDGTRRRRKVTGRRYCDMMRKFSVAMHEAPPRVSALTRDERLAAARLVGGHTASEWNRKLWESKGICEYCGHAHPVIVKEHKIPLCRGGSDSIDNIAVACEPCNQRKRRMTADEYLAVIHG